MTNETEQQMVTAGNMELNPSNPAERQILVTERSFALSQRKANVYAKSNVVPAQFRENVANCMIAMEMADRMRSGVLEVMQNLYVVHGNPAFSSSYLIARINASGIIKGRLKFEYVGKPNTDEYGCYAYAMEAETGDELRGSVVTVGIAKAEKWWGKNGSKWPNMTDQMLMYRAAAFWSRIYGGDATMGMHTKEEIGDVGEYINAERVDEGPAASTLSVDIQPKSDVIDISPEEKKKEPQKEESFQQKEGAENLEQML